MFIGIKQYSDRPTMTATQYEHAASQHAALGAIPSATSSIPPLGESIQQLDDRVRCLEDQIFTLQDRLAPVMFPCAPEAVSQSAPNTPPVPVIEAIARASEAILRMHWLINGITQRLAV